MKSKRYCLLLLTIGILCGSNLRVNAKVPDVNSICVDETFGSHQKSVDENIYKSMNIVDSSVVDTIYNGASTPVLEYFKDCINPCMAFATTWGEAGCSYPGVSLTTVMDFSPSTYKYPIDWITVARNLEQVDDMWYIVNCTDDYNTNTEGKAYHMPNKLLQFPSSGSRQTSAMTGLGVGPYQITSSDWDKWILSHRVNPIEGFRDSLSKAGTQWYQTGINPYSDLTVYALLSLSHQGGSLPMMEFGKELISIINQPDVTEAFEQVGKEIYTDLLTKAKKKEVSLADINLDNYFFKLEEMTGVDFSNYTGGVGSTNKGNYTALHCLRYVFYKNYFMSGE